MTTIDTTTGTPSDAGHAPSARSARGPARVERTRLLSMLAAGVAGGADIIALTAPAGAGKTTVLDQWLESRRAAGELVLSLSAPGSGVAGTLLPSLVGAIRAGTMPADVEVGLTERLRAALEESGPRALAPMPALPTPVWVGLDDAHQWTDTEARRQLRALVSLAGPGLRLVIAARHSPHGLLSPALLDGSANEYRSAELAFDRDEARALLGAEGIDLSDSDLESLLGRTKGWAAGLRLAALALGRRADRSVFVRNFAGTDRAVADYLVSEVLSSLEQGQIDLLLDVSVADRISLDLARVLTGRCDAGVLLEDLVRANALVGPVRDEPDCYELHPLLRTYLRAESQRRDEDRHRRHQAAAIDWFESAGDVRGAVRHAVAASDWSRVESMIAATCVRITATDGPQAMREILGSLPTWMQARPAVAGAAALTAVLEEDLAAAHLDLAVLDAAADDVPRREAYRAVALLASARTRSLGREEVSGALTALEAATGVDPDLVLVGRSLGSMALAMLGELDTAETMARSLARISRTRGLDFLLFRALGALSAVALFRSDLRAVRAVAAEAIELANRRSWYRHPRLGQLHSELALAAWQHGDTAMAAEHARAAMEVADPDIDRLTAAATLCIHDLTVGATDPGLDVTAIAHVQDFNSLWPSLPPAAVSMFACFELLVTLRCHQVELAGAIVSRVEAVLVGAADVEVFRALRHVYQGHDAAARDDLDRVRNTRFLTSRTAVIAAAITAHLADAAGRPARSHEALLEALGLAERNQMMRCLLDAAPSIPSLLRRGRGRFGRYETFVSETLAFADSRTQPDGGSGLVLTGKELEVLRDLPSMLSMREIADAHVVSINTVKTHVRSVYRKFGVATRREAVDLARQAGLL
ncbi:hypothetical protein EXU48_18980 [Occultella glacieicola]|uniref:HTH luxR-type domain-containing protein n=1 Tax=Occultella glacieicola TaxID=2518684 RepID=A0ABY2DZ93_9MICO|nr:LuxR C-terminal-related transcriptional regulator [Occultella glacieicola]TDE90009.1 hypothetical protein EXU48_18980 [Occultella glacieicola]